jgi:predicted porin
MNRKILSLAVAAAMVTPIASHADVKLSGIVQAEMISLEVAEGDEKLGASIRGNSFDDMDRQTLTNDFLGSILNEGPNHMAFDIDEKLGGGLSAQARYIAAFNSSGNFGAALIGEEAWVGLGTQYFHIRYGTLTGAYKSSHSLIDPWAFTSLQTRATGGGMSGEYFNRLETDALGNVTGINVNSWEAQNGLTNDGFVEGALELGVHYYGFSFTLQGFVDDASAMDGAGLLELRYTAPNDIFTMWLAGSYTDLSDVSNVASDIADTITDEEEDKDKNEGLGNWKIGGAYKLGSMVTFGLQYEDAEIGALDNGINPDGGRYVLGSLEFKPMPNISLAGWVAGYLSDIDDGLRMRDSEGNAIDEDALSWAVGAKYHFSQRTSVYAGYRQTDSDNDYRDENVATLGIRHVF